MKRVGLVILIISLLTVQMNSAFGESNRAQVEELITLINTKQTFDQAFAQAKQMAISNVRKMKIVQGREAEAAGVINGLTDLISKEMSWNSFKDDYIAIYSSLFTDEEIEGLLQFYKSPLGRTYLGKLPEVMQKAVAINQQRLPKIQAKIRKYLEENQELFEHN